MTDDINLHIGRMIRRRRKLMGLTQIELGARCGLTFQTIQKYETASRKVFAERLWQLAEALEVPVSYFFEGFAKRELSLAA